MSTFLSAFSRKNLSHYIGYNRKVTLREAQEPAFLVKARFFVDRGGCCGVQAVGGCKVTFCLTGRRVEDAVTFFLLKDSHLCCSVKLVSGVRQVETLVRKTFLYPFEQFLAYFQVFCRFLVVFFFVLSAVFFSPVLAAEMTIHKTFLFTVNLLRRRFWGASAA